MDVTEAGLGEWLLAIDKKHFFTACVVVRRTEFGR